MSCQYCTTNLVGLCRHRAGGSIQKLGDAIQSMWTSQCVGNFFQWHPIGHLHVMTYKNVTRETRIANNHQEMCNKRKKKRAAIKKWMCHFTLLTCCVTFSILLFKKCELANRIKMKVWKIKKKHEGTRLYIRLFPTFLVSFFNKNGL
jgi:hypothetical protein